MPKFLSDFIAGRSKRSLTIIGAAILFAIVLVTISMQIRPAVEAKITEAFDRAGFNHVSIGSLNLYPSGFGARDIKLDKYGFDEIKKLDADISWPTFFASGKMSNLEIKGVSLTRHAESFPSSGRQLANNLLNLPDYRVSISDIVLDLDTGFGAIRILIDATAEPTKDADNYKIQANVKADQYQLGFTSTWQGTLKKGGMLDLAGDVLDGRLNLGPLRVSRFNGWMGASINKDGYTLQSQLEAGSASFMNVPLQAVSVVNDSGNSQDDMIIRSGISGMPDILFTADMTRKESEQSFTASLKGKNLGGLLDYIDEVTKSDKKISEALLQMRAFELSARFQPEKRFVGGPMPFGINLNTGDKSILNGNILYYPDSFEIRGSLETNPSMALALQDYFKIPSANIVQNYIRLDGDARKFFGFDVAENTAKKQ